MPFRCEDMPESVGRIDSRTAVLDIILYQNGNYISLILFFIVLYHLFDFKIISDRFCIFFFFFFFFSDRILTFGIRSICSPAKGGNGCYRFNYQPGS